MSAEVLVFDLLSVVAILSAAGVILFRNPVHSAVSLVITFVNIAAIFVLLRAEFLAAVQIIVYTGAVLVLFLFVMMLVNREDLPEFHGGRPVQRVFGFIIGLVLFAEIAAAILTYTAVTQPGPWTEDAIAAVGGNVQAIGQVLYSEYVVAIQVIALVLLMATIGALFLGRPDEIDEPSGETIRRSTRTISLAHTRGSDRQFEIMQLGEGAVKHEAGDRDIIMAKSADEYVDWPPASDQHGNDNDGKRKE